MALRRAHRDSDMKEIHVIYPDQVAEVGSLAAFYGNKAVKCQPGTESWLAAVDKLVGITESLRKLGFSASVQWSDCCQVEAAVIDGMVFSFSDSEDFLKKEALI